MSQTTTSTPRTSQFMRTLHFMAGLALAALPSIGNAQIASATSIPEIFAPDSGTSSASYAVDLWSGADWLSTDFRLISMSQGADWIIDNLAAPDYPAGSFEFSGSGTTALPAGATVNSSTPFTGFAFLTPGPLTTGTTELIGLHRQVNGSDYYGALQFQYNDDHSLSLTNFGISLGSYSTGLVAIPEPAVNAALLTAAVTGLAALMRRRKSSALPLNATS